MRVHVWGAGVALVAGTVAAACGGEPDPTFGPADGLVGRTAPTATVSSSGGGGSSGGSGSGSSSGTSSGGTSSGSGEGGSGGSTTCAVSWATTIFPTFESTGTGQCGTQICHGGTNAPTMIDGNPATTFTNLTKYTINGLYYIDTGNTNPANSAIECNIGVTTPACGIAQMPQAPGQLDSTARTNIATWLACGAPNN